MDKKVKDIIREYINSPKGKKKIRNVFEEIDFNLLYLIQLKRIYMNVGYISLIKRERTEDEIRELDRKINELKGEHIIKGLRDMFKWANSSVS